MNSSEVVVFVSKELAANEPQLMIMLEFLLEISYHVWLIALESKSVFHSNVLH